MANEREGVDRFATDENVELYEIGFTIAGEMVIERGVAARNALQPIIKIQDDFIERHFVSEHDARGRQVLEILLHAALFLAELKDGADGIVGGDDHGGENGLFDAGDLRGRREFRGIVHFDGFVGCRRDAVTHAGGGGDEVNVEFALEALLDDFHVQEAKEAAAEAETQSGGVFGFVEKSGVVELEFSQGVAKEFIIAGVHGEKAGENHGLDGFEARKRRGGTFCFDNSVADARIGDALDIGDDEADVASGELFKDYRLRREDAQVLHFVDLIHGAEANLHPRGNAAFHHAHENHSAAVRIEPGIENQGAKRSVGCAFWSRDARDDGFEYIGDADAALRADEQGIGGGNREDVFDLLFDAVGLRGGKVNFE